ncbi:hypothetical protein HII36_23190 [Nonomuraea sp. NN258]|uniref:hypothetical protein n=1 Tax=Nonomuraea antri TaxID=2730852 RepID=UPI001568F9C2|nr:hypothetical protein [Nonomuraea antri]NRQ34714.1 hypothetical protein [Nonomuraea antri]
MDASTAVGKLARGRLMEPAAFESDRAGEQWAEAYQTGWPEGCRRWAPYFGYVRRGRQPHPLDPKRTLRAPSGGEERYEPDVESGAAEAFADCYETYVLARRLSRYGHTTEGGLP